MAAKPAAKFIRKAIRDLIEPQLSALGFVGKYPDFRREAPDEMHFLHFFSAKYGGSFSYSAAWAKRTLGKTGADSTIAHTDFQNRATVNRVIGLWKIDGTPFRAPVGGFEYSYIADDEPACRALVAEAAATLPAVDKWLRTRQEADCLVVGGTKIGSAQNPGLHWMIAQARARQGLY